MTTVRFVEYTVFVCCLSFSFLFFSQLLRVLVYTGENVETGREALVYTVLTSFQACPVPGNFGLEFAKSQGVVENKQKWRKLVVKASVVPHRPSRLGDSCR